MPLSNRLPPAGGLDPAFRRAAERVHLAGADATVRLLVQVQHDCPTVSGSVAELVFALAAWPTDYLAEPRDLLRQVDR